MKTAVYWHQFSQHSLTGYSCQVKITVLLIRDFYELPKHVSVILMMAYIPTHLGKLCSSYLGQYVNVRLILSLQPTY